MPVLQFLGKVYPAIAKVNLPGVENIDWGSSDLGFPIVMSSKISDSTVEVACVIPHFDESHFDTLLFRAYNLVEACTDLTSFGSGIALWVELDAFVTPDGIRRSILKNDSSLRSECTAFKSPTTNSQEQEEFNAALKIVLQEPTLMGSMRDLAQTLAHFQMTPINCGRVLDSLRMAVAPKLKPKPGWVALRSIVNADEDYMKWISDYSTDPRHGERSPNIPAYVAAEIRKRTWSVMNRFLEYRKAGNIPLDVSTFPLLIHDPSFPPPAR
jgi:hypothetical protein